MFSPNLLYPQTIEDDGTGYISLFLTDTIYQVKKTTSFA